MKTKSLSRITKIFVSFLMVFLWTTFSLNAQCPTVTDPTPPPVCDASGYTFANMSADYATDNGNGIVWYNAATGGSPFNNSQLVQEGTYYADDNTGTCGVRASLTIDFQVNASGQNLDQIYCSNENATVQTYIDDVLQSSIPVGGSVEVYYDLNLTNQANTTDPISSGATNYFIVFVDNGGCKSQLEIGQVGVFNAPTDPTPANPQEFCSDTNPTVGDLNPGTTATNYSWYDNLDGFGNPVLPALALSTPLVDGNTYYIQINDVFCVSNPVDVLVIIDTPVDPGTPGNLEYCNDNLPASDFNLFDELGGTPDTTGSWSGPLTTSNGHLGTVNISTLTTAGTYTFVYTVPSTGVCPDGTSNVTITVHETLSSGTPSAANPASFCEASLPAAFDLFSLLENEDPNGQWTQGTTSSDPVVTSPIDLTAFTPGTYDFTYTQNLSPNPCPEESTTVQVIVLQDPNAGVAINQIFCENDLAANSPFDLFNALDGSQDNNSGTWTDSSNTTISNILDLTTLNVAGSPYTFIYTIDNGTCSVTESITITVEPAPESGTPVATFPEFCEGTAPASYDLFDLLTGEDQTGTWYIGNDNTGTSSANPVDLSILTSGTYNFTFDVEDIGSCDDVLVTVSVTINPLPITGTPTAAIFCENDLAANSPLDLFGQLTGEDVGGTWTDDNTTGALSGSNVDLTLLTIGSYNFTYTITDVNGCTNSSTVTVTVEDAPESGTPNTPVEFCLADITVGQTYDLFDLLTGEDQTGTWNDDDSTGALAGNTVTLDGLAQGTYNFTFDVDAIGSCDDANVTVSIVINDTPAPSASSPQEFCDTAIVADLVATGTTIQWYDVSIGGTPLAGTTALIDAQTYYATQTDATTGCESSVRTPVLATIYQSPNAGNPNATPIVACNNDSNIDLFTGLDGTQDAGGTWQDTDGTGALSGNIFDGTAVSTGTYQFTYYVTASAPCVDDSTIITVTIEAPLNAGSDNTLDVCSNNGTTDLFTLLGGADIGGTWSPALTSGTGVFDPLVDVDGTYTYTLTNACGTETSDVVVTVTLAPNAGTDATVALCMIDAPTDLFLSLGAGAQSGGTWSPALNSGTGVFDPAIDVPGVYTYTVTAVSPCSPDSTADITVTVDDTPTPTVANNNPEFCLVDNPIVSDLDSTISSSGSINWYEDAALTMPLTGTEALVDGEDYYATQTNSSGCESSTAVQIDVIINDTATPTLLDPTAEYCINDGPTILDLSANIAEYNSSTNNVVWYDAATGGSVISNSSTLTNITYYAVLIDATTGCESSVRLAVTPDVTACGKLQIPDGFSPNGDGVNDTFDVDNLAILYPNFEMEIYNRNGNIVYKGNANTPRFDGTSNQSRVVSKGDLPVGVYFYIFKFNDGENKPEQGRLYLSR
ncbi:gliding motility-associated C-terminal domain-containing protein [Sabulilitoribacter multivorans]|uniref:Gliding motility-associated C-terminal domain-containing protein n=1 Tax=Flaviramulus multivorans TaxID=1304750 RepID=A0ABS9IEQ6_9FLAO|nr:gliding motility-associated C-terminal domain-containing protein [Flaviramulus multivorans]MCF7559269.1 gliding motility-associated C-terminal domain-containing protein [Flaviramulus multivorans]